MQSIEAMISLLVFLSIAAHILSADPGPPSLDDSLYRMQLAEDAWRVLYLRGNLKDMDSSQTKRMEVEADMALIGEQTGFCIFMRGIEFTNCRDKEPHNAMISIKRTVLFDNDPVAVTFTLSR